jgi:flavin-binding protein dodecin
MVRRNRPDGDEWQFIQHAAVIGCKFVSMSTKEQTMSVARITEIISSSKTSFEDAIEKGVERAAKTLKNVEGAWVKEQKVIVKNGKISEYRVGLKVTFILID